MTNRHHPYQSLGRFAFYAMTLVVFHVSQVFCQETLTNNSAVSSDSQAARLILSRTSQASHSFKSIQADLRQVVNVGGQPLTLNGRYISGADLRLRMEFEFALPNAAQGTMLEVCDGQTLYSYLKLGDSARCTRREIRKILNAAQVHGINLMEQPGTDLGLGGVPGLLSSLQKTMEFDEPEKVVVEQIELDVVTGKWNSAFRERWAKKGPAPTWMPDGVRIWIRRDVSFPVRFVYFRTQANDQSRPLVQLEFRNLRFNERVDEKEFLYIPREDLVPEDTTRRYIEQIVQRH